MATDEGLCVPGYTARTGMRQQTFITVATVMAVARTKPPARRHWRASRSVDLQRDAAATAATDCTSRYHSPRNWPYTRICVCALAL